MRDTIDMAREAGVVPYVFASVDEECLSRLKAFEALVRADEREACAKVCEEHQFASIGLATAIRARSCPPCNEDCNQGRNCPARSDK